MNTACGGSRPSTRIRRACPSSCRGRDGWRGACAVGRVVSQLDLNATMLDALDCPALPNSSGRSLLPLLDNADSSWEDVAFSEFCLDAPALEDRFRTRGVYQRMVRRGPWKLNYYHGFPSQLFNLEEDPREMADRMGDPSCKVVVNELTAAVPAGLGPRHRRRRDGAQAGGCPNSEWLGPQHDASRSVPLGSATRDELPRSGADVVGIAAAGRSGSRVRGDTGPPFLRFRPHVHDHMLDWPIFHNFLDELLPLTQHRLLTGLDLDEYDAPKIPCGQSVEDDQVDG